MDDLITQAGFDDFVFLIIVIFSIASSLMKHVKKKQQDKPGEQPKRPAGKIAASLEEFFTDLAEKIEPEKVDTNEWVPPPEWVEVEEEPVELKTMPALEPVMSVEAETEHDDIVRESSRPQHHSTVMTSGSQGLHLPSMTLSRGSSVNYRIKGKRALKQAILGQIVFSPPRAYDLSFENNKLG